MLIVPNKQALVINPREPGHLLASIPTAKTFTFRGEPLIAMPHGLDEAKVLRNLGIYAPSPINYYYEYPLVEGKHPPFDHQRKTCDFLTMVRRGAVLNEQRTGKTLSCLWSFDYLRKLGKIRRVLIVAPLSTLDDVWANAIFGTFWWYKYAVLHGSREKRLRLLKTDADIFIVNHHGFDIIADDLPDDIDLCIYDEAAVMRNPATTFFRSFNGWLTGRPDLWLWLLTGTPTPNEPTDAWALCKLIGAPVPRYSAFRDIVMYKAGMWSWLPRPNSADIVAQYLQPAIRFKRDECFDLPDNITETRSCELSAEQKRMLKDMLRSLAAETAGKQITAVSEAAKIQKLLQILLGCVYSDDGGSVAIDPGTRPAVIKELIEECSEKVVVFVPFTGALHALAAELRKHFTLEVVNGEVSKSKRDEIFKAFRNPAGPRVIVADARTMSHGLDLTAASSIIWAGPTNSNDVFQQACARIWGPKQKHKTSIVHVVATDIERRVFKRLADKQSMQGLLLEIVQSKGDSHGN